MKTAYLTSLKKIEILEDDIPVIGNNQVLIKMKHVGICGSDLHFYEHGRVGDFVVQYPFVLGHEGGGEVVRVGRDVTSLKEGDRVAMEPGIPCGKCEFCKAGKYNLCPEVKFWAAPPVKGCLSEYVAYPEEMCFPVADNMGTMEAAMIEPLAVGMHAVAQSGYKMGDTAVILGSGCIGLCTLLALQTAGVRNTILVDMVDSRLKQAKNLGARHTVNAAKADVKEEVFRITNGMGADLVFETAGAKPTTQTSVGLAKRGGTITIVGMAPDASVEFNFGTLIFNEISIKTVFRYRNIYKSAVELVGSGAIDIQKVVTNVFKFEECDSAFAKCIADKVNIVKGVIAY